MSDWKLFILSLGLGGVLAFILVSDCARRPVSPGPCTTVFTDGTSSIRTEDLYWDGGCR